MSQPQNVADKELVGPLDLSDERWREYEFHSDGRIIIYRIDDPISLFYRIGGTTHRVVDSRGVVHCVPTVGHLGCVLRWKTKKEKNPVAF